MTELEFRSDAANLPVDEFDNFAQNFRASLILENKEGDGPIYWHGRLIGFGDPNGDNTWEPYHLSFLGSFYSEKIFRHKLESDEIIITKFEPIGNPVYARDAVENASSYHIDQTTVTYRARFWGTVNGQPFEDQEISVTQKIRRTYLTYDTRISLV